MNNWRAFHVGMEGDDVAIGRVELWRHVWRQVGGQPVMLPHPSYPQQHHRFIVYETGPKCGTVRFAAAELSNGVWGFYSLL